MIGWKTSKLTEVCNLKSGTTISNKLERVNGDVIYAKVGDMNLFGNEEYITVSSRYVFQEEINRNQIIPIGSIIFPKRGGAIATNKKRKIIKPTIVDLNTMALVPTDAIDPDYLFFWFKQLDLSTISSGTSIPQINNYSFENIFISYPASLVDQKRIVIILDEAFAAISKAKQNTEKNLQNAKELFDSFLSSISSQKQRLQNLVKIRTGKLDSNAANSKGQYPFFTCAREIFQIDTFAFDCEAILLAGNNASGDFNVKHYNGRFNAYQRTYVITVDDVDILQYRFLYYQLLKSLKFLKNESVGAATKFLKLGIIKDLVIDLPPISDQKSIAEKLDFLFVETEKLDTIFRKKLAILEELKNTVLQKAFAGELTNKEIPEMI